MISDVIFDCFGTLVRYAPDRRRVQAGASYDVAVRLGLGGSYGEFIAVWDSEARDLEADSRRTGREFLMEDLVHAFVSRNLPGSLAPSDARELMLTYLSEWRRAVQRDPDAAGTVRVLGRHYRLSVITNTHYPPLVEDVLEATGIAGDFEQVVTSAEVGFRKPHEAIFRAALRRLGIGPGSALFVGDSYEDDFLGAVGAGLRAVLLDPEGRYVGRVAQRVTRLSDLPGAIATAAAGPAWPSSPD